MTHADPGSARWLTKQPGYLHDERVYWFDVLRDAAALAFVLLMAFAFLWWLT